MRESRRGHEDDVILARDNQYSTGPASASHTFFQKVTLKEKITPLDWSATGLFLLDQEPTLGGGVAGVHGRPRS